MYTYIYIYVWIYIPKAYPKNIQSAPALLLLQKKPVRETTSSRLLQILGLFCKRAL